MDRQIDVPKTRRRVEDALRKTDNVEKLIEVAGILDVKVASLMDEIPEMEKKLAYILELNHRGEIPEELYNMLESLFPPRFEVYYVSRMTAEKNAKNIFERETRNFFTQKDAKRNSVIFGGPPRRIETQQLTLLGARKAIREIREKKIDLSPDELKVVQQLKSVIY